MYLFLPHARSYLCLQAHSHSFRFYLLLVDNSFRLLTFQISTGRKEEEQLQLVPLENNSSHHSLVLHVPDLRGSHRAPALPNPAQSSCLIQFAVVSYRCPTDMQEMSWSWGTEQLQFSHTEALQGRFTLAENGYSNRKYSFHLNKETSVDCENGGEARTAHVCGAAADSNLIFTVIIHNVYLQCSGLYQLHPTMLFAENLDFHYILLNVLLETSQNSEQHGPANHLG